RVPHRSGQGIAGPPDGPRFSDDEGSVAGRRGTRGARRGRRPGSTGPGQGYGLGVTPAPSFDPSDFLGLDALLSDEERDLRDTVRQFVRDRVLPGIQDWFERGEFPVEMAKELGSLGLFGMHLTGYGCAGASAVQYGLACTELEAGDSAFRSFVSVQGSLAMFPIWKFGSDEQKEEWLPKMAAGEAIGCFGLTEPDVGSDPSSMRTTARLDGDEWVLNGSKMWITNGGVADLAIVWARTDDGVRGF